MLSVVWDGETSPPVRAAKAGKNKFSKRMRKRVPQVIELVFSSRLLG
jgi:hypothetical protein